MLGLLRKSTNTLPFKIFFVILIASFGVWGIDALRGKGLGTEVATVGSNSISAIEYDRALRMQVEKAREMVKGKVPISTLLPMIQSQVYTQLVQQKLLNALADDMKLNISNNIIKDVILKQYLQNDEKFDFKRFKLMLNRSGYSEKQFVEIIKKDMERAFIAGAIFPSIFVPDSFVQTIHKDYYTPRTYQVVIFTEKNVYVDDKIKESDLKDFYAIHKPKYALPEMRSVQAFIFSPEIFEKKIKKENKGFTDSEVQQSSIERTHKLTQEIEDQLAAGMTFNEISKKYKLPIYTAKNIDLEGNAASQKRAGRDNSFLTTDMINTAFELDMELESDTRSLTDGRSYIIKVTDIKKTRIPAFKDVKKAVRADYLLELRREALKKNIQKFVEILTKGSIDLATLAKKSGLRVKTFTDIRATKDVPPALTLDVVEKVLKQPLKTYFGLISDKKGYVGRVIKLGRITPVSKARHKENLEAIRKGLKGALTGAFLHAIFTDLKKEHPVVSNNIMIERILASYR